MLAKISFFSKQLNLKLYKSIGRPLAIKPEKIIALSLFKQAQGIETKKSLFERIRLMSVLCLFSLGY